MSPEAVRRVLPLGLLVALLVVAVSACRGEVQQGSKARLLPEVRQEISSGEYRSEEFEPSLSFRVGEGWSTSPPELSDALLITRGGTGGLGFASAREVYKPTKSGMPDVVEAPEDMSSWYREHPYLRTSEPEPVTVGGVEGKRFDVVLGDLPADYFGICGRDCVATLRFSDGTRLGIYPKQKLRLIFLEGVEGETVIIGFGARASEFDEHAPEARKVLDSVKWGGS